MALIDSGSKSSRLLASRRYTHDTFTTAQESFTNVLDLQDSEIYTQASKIPSSGLPFSSSADIGSIYQDDSNNIMKYWFRQKLTKSNLNNETWFFLNPTGSDSGVGAQLIDSNQQTNFISPKYGASSLASSTTEDATPGYLAVLYKSSAISHSLQTGSLDGDDIVSTNDYIFDYKTGIVQFMNSGVDPSDSQYVYMTVYQYVGTSLATGLNVSGSTKIGYNPSISSHQITGSLLLDSTAFKYGASTWKEASGVNELTGSSWEFKSSVGSGDLFIFKDNSDDLVFKATQEKALVLGEVVGNMPTAVAGGLVYSGSNAWYLGYENPPD
tara:strand:+ start:394 stop:1371 length:978 start_codon:yes stop_codon:yes gene_type:complete